MSITVPRRWFLDPSFPVSVGTDSTGSSVPHLMFSVSDSSPCPPVGTPAPLSTMISR